MANNNTRTDLAYERIPKQSGAGISYTEKRLGVCRLHSLYVSTRAAARHCHCEKGTYHTLCLPPVTTLTVDEREEVITHVCSLLEEMAASLLNASGVCGRRILLVGLGNRANTPDALGPLIAERVRATAHLKKECADTLKALACAEIAVVAPGVPAGSGMASTELVSAAVRQFEPELVLAVDALAARSFSRLASTVQITDTGITPGSGTGGKEARLNAATLGCPVLAVGVPTVTDSITLINDTFASAGIKPPRAWCKRAALTEACYICPPEVDIVIKRFVYILSTAINRSFGIPAL